MRFKVQNRVVCFILPHHITASSGSGGTVSIIVLTTLAFGHHRHAVSKSGGHRHRHLENRE
jgi:hypothetical protein